MVEFMTIEVFIKKPERVEVLKYDGTNYDEVVKFLGKQMCNLKCVDTNDYIVKFNNKPRNIHMPSTSISISIVMTCRFVPYFLLQTASFSILSN